MLFRPQCATRPADETAVACRSGLGRLNRVGAFDACRAWFDLMSLDPSLGSCVGAVLEGRPYRPRSVAPTGDRGHSASWLLATSHSLYSQRLELMTTESNNLLWLPTKARLSRARCSAASSSACVGQAG